MRAVSKRRRGSRASAELVGVLLFARLPRVVFAIFNRIPYHCPGVTFSDRGPWAGWIMALISAPNSSTADETKK
jgi:hypothetical protein